MKQRCLSHFYRTEPIHFWSSTRLAQRWSGWEASEFHHHTASSGWFPRCWQKHGSMSILCIVPEWSLRKLLCSVSYRKIASGRFTHGLSCTLRACYHSRRVRLRREGRHCRSHRWWLSFFHTRKTDWRAQIRLGRCHSRPKQCSLWHKLAWRIPCFRTTSSHRLQLDPRYDQGRQLTSKVPSEGKLELTGKRKG